MIFPDRAFLYGDLLFETMLAKGKDIPLLSRHYHRLAQGASILQMEMNHFDEQTFQSELEKALSENLPDAPYRRVRCVLSRQGSGFYLPQSNETSFAFDVQLYTPPDSAKLVRAGLYTEQQKAPGPLSNLKSGNALLYVMASLHAKENGWDDALICNAKGEIIEATSSNIFWKKDGNWYTPPLSSGCVAGVGRALFMESNQVTETTCDALSLHVADECLLTNALTGPRKFQLVNH